MYQPRPFIVTARAVDAAESPFLVGVASFVEMGDYNYLYALAVREEYQKQGIGRELLRRGIAHSRLHYAGPGDEGLASVLAVMASERWPQDPIEKPAFRQYGFKKMFSAAALLRRDQQDGGW
jgi:ribosomal protein S18 acetylase RimI-like enzyme